MSGRAPGEGSWCGAHAQAPGVLLNTPPSPGLGSLASAILTSPSKESGRGEGAPSWGEILRALWDGPTGPLLLGLLHPSRLLFRPQRHPPPRRTPRTDLAH